MIDNFISVITSIIGGIILLFLDENFNLKQNLNLKRIKNRIGKIVLLNENQLSFLFTLMSFLFKVLIIALIIIFYYALFTGQFKIEGSGDPLRNLPPLYKP